MDNEGGEKKPTKPKIKIRITLKENEALTWAKIAEQIAERGKGAKIFTQKPHGFAGELEANTKGFAKTARFCVLEYDRNVVERMRKAADLTERENAIKEEKKRLGLA